FGVRTNEAGVLERVQKYLPLGWEPSDSAIVDMVYSLKIGKPSQRKGTRHYNLLYMGAGLMGRSMELEGLFSELEANLQLLAAYRAEGYLFVHAGAVGWQGQAIVIPGRSFCGKTTLVSALVRAGATYYSDEFTVFDAQGRVHPYPLPLSIRDETGRNAQ